MSNIKSPGFTCWLTGLSGAGKSTLAVEIVRALEHLSVPCEYLDGDIIRTNLSKGLGFSCEDRKTNIARVGFVSGLLNKHGINTVVALISPYRDAREQLRLNLPNFIEVYVDAPLEVCMERDVKGLYKKAIAGEIPEFTGISSLYEPPLNPDLILKTHKETIAECVEKVLRHLFYRGFITQASMAMATVIKLC
ncbi:adenylyl-sulfate kinase [Scytonema sp. NUACC26]|uniref:adenylyl-sulfate kinase n=1 Tax=Scytonema sp. NUACC26 TaxID=3140176 RepID=UPI0034DC7826